MGFKKIVLVIASLAIVLGAEISMAQTALEQVTRERAQLLNRGLSDGAAAGLAVGANPLLDEEDRETIIAAAQMNVDKLKVQFEDEKLKLVQALKAIEDNKSTHVTYTISGFLSAFLSIPTATTGILGFSALMSNGRHATSTKVFGGLFAASVVLQAIAITATLTTAESVNLREDEVQNLYQVINEISVLVAQEQQVIDFLINNPGVDVRQFITQD